MNRRVNEGCEEAPEEEEDDEDEDEDPGGEHFRNRAPIFFEQQPRLARVRTMHSGFNKTATIRVKTAKAAIRRGGIVGTGGRNARGLAGGKETGIREEATVAELYRAREWESGG